MPLTKYRPEMGMRTQIFPLSDLYRIKATFFNFQIQYKFLFFYHQNGTIYSADFFFAKRHGMVLQSFHIDRLR